MKGFEIVFPEPRKNRIETFKLREPAKDESLIETKATLISTGIELTSLTDEFPDQSAWSTYIKYPFAPRYSSVGKVIKCVSKVENVSVGDVVTAMSLYATRSLVKAKHLIKVGKH